MGLGLGIGLSGSLIVVQNEVVIAEAGATIGFIRFLQSLGGAVGLSLLTAFQEWRLQVDDAGATSPSGLLNGVVASYQQVFLVASILVFVAFAFALLLRGRVPAGSGTAPRST